MVVECGDTEDNAASNNGAMGYTGNDAGYRSPIVAVVPLHMGNGEFNVESGGLKCDKKLKRFVGAPSYCKVLGVLRTAPYRPAVTRKPKLNSKLQRRPCQEKNKSRRWDYCEMGPIRCANHYRDCEVSGASQFRHGTPGR